MTKTATKTKKLLFPLEYYDKDFCLKVNFFTMAVMLVCCRSLLITITAAMAKGGANAIIEFFFYNQVTMFASLIVVIPTLLVLIAWARKHSGANKVIRIFWRYGKFLLLTSTLMNLAIDIYSMTSRPNVEGLDVSLLTIDGLCLIYILQSKILGAIFKDFPETKPVQ